MLCFSVMNRRGKAGRSHLEECEVQAPDLAVGSLPAASGELGGARDPVCRPAGEQSAVTQITHRAVSYRLPPDRGTCVWVTFHPGREA